MNRLPPTGSLTVLVVLSMAVSFRTSSQHSNWSVRTDVYVMFEDPLQPSFQKYGAADFRWGFTDPTVVSLEILTVRPRIAELG